MSLSRSAPGVSGTYLSILSLPEMIYGLRLEFVQPSDNRVDDDEFRLPLIPHDHRKPCHNYRKPCHVRWSFSVDFFYEFIKTMSFF